MDPSIREDGGPLPASAAARDGMMAELLSMGFDTFAAVEAVTTQGIASLPDAVEFLLGQSQTVAASTICGGQRHEAKPTSHIHEAIKPAMSSATSSLQLAQPEFQSANTGGCEADESWKSCSIHYDLFAKAETVLSKHFGFSRLKPFQMETLRAWENQQDCLVLAATGSGKSLCFQLPALLTGKVVVVVSPLISLMHDQCLQLSRRGITACFLGSGQGDKSVEKKAMVGMYNIVYVCPETLPRLMNSLKELACKRGIALFAIDEAHCISKWGHDFRPDYRRLSAIREAFQVHSLPGLKVQVPIMALTATATDCVQLDIMKSLKLDTLTARIVRTTLFRPNLRFSVHHSKTCRPSSYGKDFKVLLKYYARGSGITSQVNESSSGNTSFFIGKGATNSSLEKQPFEGGHKLAYWEHSKKSKEVTGHLITEDMKMDFGHNKVEDKEGGEEEEVENEDTDEEEDEDIEEVPVNENGKLELTVDFLEDDDEDEVERLGGDFEVAWNDDLSIKYKSMPSRSSSNMIEHGPSIIYVPTRKETERVAKFLCHSGLKAAPYHAKLAKGHLRKVHEQFHLGTLQVVVATIAFGMGIDKPDVRHIIHYGWPQSLEAYYQEAGRAGRDGLPSECRLYCDMTVLPSLLPSRRNQEQTDHALFMLDQCFRYGLSANKCRANTLLKYFGEDLTTTRCEICDVCTSGPPPLENLTMEAEMLLKLLSGQKDNHGPSTTGQHILNQRKRRADSYGDKRAYQQAVEEIGKCNKVPQRDHLWWRGFGRILADAGFLKEPSPVVNSPRKLIVPHLRNPEVTCEGHKFLDNQRRELSASFSIHPEGDMIQAMLAPPRLSRQGEWGRGWADPEVRKQRFARFKFSRRQPPQKRQRRSRYNSRGKQRLSGPSFRVFN